MDRSLALPLVLGCALLALLADVATPAGASEPPPPGRLPARVEAIGGEMVDLADLARRRTLVVVTIKSPSCPVCARQLERLRVRLPDLRACGLTFVVLGPGPAAALHRLRKSTGLDVPFVEDRGLALARSLGLGLGEEEITPAFLMARQDLSIGWIQRGRSARSFGDDALQSAVECWLVASLPAQARAQSRSAERSRESRSADTPRPSRRNVASEPHSASIAAKAASM